VDSPPLRGKDWFETITTDLLQFGADPNVQNAAGEIPQYLAARLGHDSIITLLLKHAADSSLTNRRGETPRDYAALDSSIKIFASPPVVEWTKVGHGKRAMLQLPPRPPTDQEGTVCENVTAKVLSFGIESGFVSQETTLSVYELYLQR
jgi:ankyrin repeat protein